MKRILITGGKGYLGRRMCQAFVENSDFEVAVTSRNFDPIVELPSVEIIQVNQSTDDLSLILKGFDTVIHLAALDAPECVKKPVEAIDVNVTDTVRWLEAVANSSVKTFIYFSTIHVYGSALTGVFNEESVSNPSHPYSITHKCAEDYVSMYGSRHNFKTFIFRLSNSIGYPIGEMKQWNLLLPDLCRTVLQSGKITLHSNPNTQRDFIAIEEVLNAVLYFLQTDLESGIYNLSSGKNRKLLEIATMVKELAVKNFGIDATINFPEDANNSIVPFEISNQKLLKTGFVITNDLEKEIAGLLSFCKSQESL